MTNEELDKARSEEAWRMYANSMQGSLGTQPEQGSRFVQETCAKIAARLAREGWEPTDPDLLAVREIVASLKEEKHPTFAETVRRGLGDDRAEVVIALAAYKAALAKGRGE